MMMSLILPFLLDLIEDHRIHARVQLVIDLHRMDNAFKHLKDDVIMSHQNEEEEKSESKRAFVTCETELLAYST